MLHDPLRRRVLRALSVALSVALAAPPLTAGAQGFPTQPIRIIVPIAPGGATDVGTRGLTASAAEAVAQPLIIDNVVGAAGVTGVLQVMNARPDGHTLLSFDTALITLPLFQPNVPVRPAQFRPVGIFQIRGAWLLTRPKSGWKTLDDFVQAARSRPGQITVGVPSKGSPQELAVTALEDTYKIKVNVIPYQGGAPTMAALLGDQIDAAMTGSPAGLDAVKAGQAVFLVASTKLEIEGFPAGSHPSPTSASLTTSASGPRSGLPPRRRTPSSPSSAPSSDAWPSIPNSPSSPRPTAPRRSGSGPRRPRASSPPPSRRTRSCSTFSRAAANDGGRAARSASYRTGGPDLGAAQNRGHQDLCPA
jgi:tripartite-type tricarboxylate transporter receptor subunit TctC